MKNRKKQGNWKTGLVHGAIGVYGLLCLWLFYHQSIAVLPETGNGAFQSDLPLHLSMVLEDGWYYSFTAFVYKILDVVFAGSTVGTAIFLCAVATACVYATDLLLEELGVFLEDWYRLALALSLNFVMPLFLPAVGEFRYVSYQSGNVWHNSTYLCMKLFALLTLVCYFRLERKYAEGITWKEWIIFALLNILTTGVKPSFLVAYSPIVGAFLLADLIKGVPIKRVLAFGSALLPSGLVILWQNMVLFGQDTGSSIQIEPWKNFSQHTNIPKAAVLLSVLFCVLAILYVAGMAIWNRLSRTKKQDGIPQALPEISRQDVFIFFMTAAGFLEALLFTESGYRAAAGNFLWGYYFGIFALFTACSRIWISLKKDGAQGIVKWVLTFVYGWHLYCGIYFFALLVSGVGYFM